MKHSQRDILAALNIIKDTCEEMPSCEECPFRYNDPYKCYVSLDGVIPEDWEINTERETDTNEGDMAWRAIRD